jgi:hypothetical protein
MDSSLNLWIDWQASDLFPSPALERVSSECMTSTRVPLLRSVSTVSSSETTQSEERLSG